MTTSAILSEIGPAVAAVAALRLHALFHVPFRVSNAFSIEASATTPMNLNTAFGGQQDIGFATVADVEYVGNFGPHLYSERNLNLLSFWQTLTAIEY